MNLANEDVAVPAIDVESVPIVSDPTAPTAEAVRALRTHIMARHIGRGHRALAICAPSNGVGCTFLAVNLAVALSQVGVNTLLIDGDLCNPSVSTMLGLAEDRPGLRQYLATPGSGYSDYLERNLLPNLTVMFAGGAASDAEELLANDRFENLMGTCLRNFDATIIDTPAANQSADCSRIGNVVSYCLLVARKNQTYVHDIKILAEQLKADHARIIGTVLNDA